jgi:hypothetical protein
LAPRVIGGRVRHYGVVEGRLKRRRIRLLAVAIGAVLLAGVGLRQDGPPGLADCGSPVPMGPEPCLGVCPGLQIGGGEYRCRYDPGGKEIPTTTIFPQPVGPLTTTSSAPG